MPDLGRYAVEVTLAYSGALILLCWIVAQSAMASRRVKRALDKAEKRKTDA
jgi:heme exporter protein D